MSEEEKVEPKVFMGGMGVAIEDLGPAPELKEGDEGYVAPDPEPDELKFGDEGYVLKEGDEGFTPPDPADIDYGTFEKDDLITEVNKFKSSVSEKEATILQMQEDKDNGTADSEDAVILKALSEDFIGNYDKAKEKFNLPSIDTLKQLVSEGNIDDKIKHWQDNELTKLIEQKHSLEPGEFEYDSNDASKAGTASYDWSNLSNDKRAELVGSLRTLQNAEVVRLRAVEQQQADDAKWLAETYYDNDEQAVEAKLKAMYDEVDLIAQGKSTPDKHPFAIRNLVRGVYFEEMAQAKTDKAIESLIAQFAEHEMYLPSKELPTNLAEVKATPKPAKKLEIDENRAKVSPMLTSILRTANK